MMQAGKNVVIEKPMSMNSKMVKELTDKAKEQGVFIMEVCGDTYRHGHGTGCVYHGGMLWRLQTRPGNRVSLSWRYVVALTVKARKQGVFIMEVCGDTCRHGQGTGVFIMEVCCGACRQGRETGCLYHGGMLWRLQSRPGNRVSLPWRYVVAPTVKARKQGVFIMEVCCDAYSQGRETGCLYHGGMLWRLQSRPGNRVSLSWRYVVAPTVKARKQGVFVMEVCCGAYSQGRGTDLIND